MGLTFVILYSTLPIHYHGTLFLVAKFSKLFLGIGKSDYAPLALFVVDYAVARGGSRIKKPLHNLDIGD